MNLKSRFQSSAFIILVLLLASVIRLWDLSNTPISLYWDEMDVGYQAYSILNTGKDYFGNFLPLTPHSFADFRAPVFIYLTIPFIQVFDLTALGVRLPAAVAAVVSIYLIFLVAKEILENKKLALIAALILAFSPWHIHYSRMSFEATTMLTFFLLGVYGFFKGLKAPKWFIVSSIGFSLSMWTYNTAKLFVPLTIFILAVLFFKSIKTNFKKPLLIALLIFIIQGALLFYSNFFMEGGQRFSEISVFTDPQIASKVDYLRFQSALSFSENQRADQQTRLIDKIVYNKPILILDRLSANFIEVFSTEFLFLSGDPNLRHSASIVGQFYRIEFLTFILGLAVLITNLKKRKMVFLSLWILTAPIPAIFTRDGGNHATRLFFLLPALILVITLGVGFMGEIFTGKIKKIAFIGYFLIFFFQASIFLNFYFGAYSWESGEGFQDGFSQLVRKAIELKGEYDYVIIDDRRDSALMSYLFESKMDPVSFQSGVNNMKVELLPRFEALKLDNIYFMFPSEKNWYGVFDENKLSGKVLLIASAKQMDNTSPEKVAGKLTNKQKLLGTIRYKSGIPAFYIIESKNAEN